MLLGVPPAGARGPRRAGAGAQVCAHDIEEVCVYERDSLDNIEGFDARVITCLQARPRGGICARALGIVRPAARSRASRSAKTAQRERRPAGFEERRL